MIGHRIAVPRPQAWIGRHDQPDACTQCHVGATNFDIGGAQGQIEAAMFELQSALNDAGWLTRSRSNRMLT